MRTYDVDYGRTKLSVFHILLCVFIGIVFVTLILFPICRAVHTETYTVTITDKGYSGEEDGYMIWAEDENGVQYEFTNKDTLFRGKFDSVTIQGKLKEKQTYELTVVGWRIPVLSEYPNIIGYKLIENDELRED